MDKRIYNIPDPVIDEKEEKQLITVTEKYKKATEENVATKNLKKIKEKVPEPIKDIVITSKTKLTDAEVYTKAIEIIGTVFNALEKAAAKVTLSENQVLELINKNVDKNEIDSLSEICLARSYEISKVVSKTNYIDIISTIVEGAGTGFFGFAGLPFNILLSTFLFYRSVQSIALFYGYDVKNDPAEFEIASEIFINAISPNSASNSELSATLTKIMLLTSTTTVKQTVKKGWQAMAEKGGITLLLTQMRALANKAAQKALQKAGEKGIEKAAFKEVFEQIGKKLTQKTISKAVPYVGAVIGATIDTYQMSQVLKYANLFYQKRFILEKEERINLLTNSKSAHDTNEYINVDFEEVT